MKALPNTQLKGFESAIQKGKALMMVHVPKGDVDTVPAMVKKHHPEANMKGVERSLPAFP